MIDLMSKDLDRVRYYSSNALTFIRDMRSQLESVPEEKRDTTKVELNDAMKIQISNTIENLILSISYLYDFPVFEFNDSLIRINYLICDGTYENCLNNIQDADKHLIDNYSILPHLPSVYCEDLMTYQFIYDLKHIDTLLTYEEVYNIVYMLGVIYNFSLLLCSEGRIDAFMIYSEDEYDDMVSRYTLMFNDYE